MQESFIYMKLNSSIFLEMFPCHQICLCDKQPIEYGWNSY